MHIPKLNEWRSDGRFTDIIIEIDGRQFNCHRVALASASEYFDTMLGSSFPESKSETFTLREVIDAATFELILQVMYTGDTGIVGITTDNVYNLLRADDFLKLRDSLETKCVQFIANNLPIPRMFDAVMFAWMTERSSLLYYLTYYFSLHIDEFLKWEEFLELPFEIIKMIIDLSILNEEVVLNATLQWINYAREERLQYFGQLIHLGMLECVSRPRLKSIVKSTVPEIACNEVFSYTEDEVMKDDSFLRVYWHIANSKRRSFTARLLQVDIKNNGKCVISKTQFPMWHMRNVVFADSHIFCAQIMRWETFEFNFLETSRKKARKNLKPPPDVHFRGWDDFQMSGLQCTNRIYLYFTDRSLLYEYNCEKNEWYSLKNSKKLVGSGMTTCETNNTLYLIGGQQYECIYSSSEDWIKERTRYARYAEAYDCHTEKWRELPKLKYEYPEGAPTCTYNGKLYVYNEITGEYEVYDPSSNEWYITKPNPYMIDKECPSLFDRRPDRVEAYRNELWLFGVAKINCREQKNKVCVHIYKPESNTWRNYPLMNAKIQKDEKLTDLAFSLFDIIIP